MFENRVLIHNLKLLISPILRLGNKLIIHFNHLLIYWHRHAQSRDSRLSNVIYSRIVNETHVGA